MSKDEKPGAVRPFLSGDRQDWMPIGGDAYQGFANPRGWALVHAVVQKAANEGSLRDLYDQFLMVEDPGTIVVPRIGQKVGMVQNYRFVGERLLPDIDYVRKLVEGNLWAEVCASLGTWKWELPRGIGKPPDAGVDLRHFVLAAAKVEADEEGGFEVTDERICGRINPNSTFFPHAQYVVAARVTKIVPSSPEERELIGRAQAFSRNEIEDMIEKGQLDDALSLSALVVSGFWR